MSRKLPWAALLIAVGPSAWGQAPSEEEVYDARERARVAKLVEAARSPAEALRERYAPLEREFAGLREEHERERKALSAELAQRLAEVRRLEGERDEFFALVRRRRAAHQAKRGDHLRELASLERQRAKVWRVLEPYAPDRYQPSHRYFLARHQALQEAVAAAKERLAAHDARDGSEGSYEGRWHGPSGLSRELTQAYDRRDLTRAKLDAIHRREADLDGGEAILAARLAELVELYQPPYLRGLTVTKGSQRVYACFWSEPGEERDELQALLGRLARLSAIEKRWLDDLALAREEERALRKLYVRRFDEWQVEVNKTLGWRGMSDLVGLVGAYFTGGVKGVALQGATVVADWSLNAPEVRVKDVFSELKGEVDRAIRDGEPLPVPERDAALEHPSSAAPPPVIQRLLRDIALSADPAKSVTKGLLTFELRAGGLRKAFRASLSEARTNLASKGSAATVLGGFALDRLGGVLFDAKGFHWRLLEVGFDRYVTTRIREALESRLRYLRPLRRQLEEELGGQAERTIRRPEVYAAEALQPGRYQVSLTFSREVEGVALRFRGRELEVGTGTKTFQATLQLSPADFAAESPPAAPLEVRAQRALGGVTLPLDGHAATKPYPLGRIDVPPLPKDFGAYERRADDFHVLRLRPSKPGMSIVILLDASGSMKGERIAAAKRAIQRAGEAFTEDNEQPVELALWIFKGKQISPVCPFTRDPKQLVAKVADVSTGGATPLSLAILRAGGYLLAESRYQQRLLLLLTDGKNTDSGDPQASLRHLRGLVTDPRGFVVRRGY